MGKLSQYQSSQAEHAQKASLSESDVMSKYNQYKDMPADKLSQELYREVGRQKQNGTFDFAQLSNMVDSLKGSLPEEQFQNMKRLLDSIK